MKKSNTITLALITAVLASCHKEPAEREKLVYMRSDTTAVYQAPFNVHNDNHILWFYAFRPYGHYSGGSYHRSGYYSSSISESSNIGHSTTKSSVVRGGFGGGHYSVSS